ncbi:ion channel [Pedobacter sp. MW01-1-1]|uniref:ion channel n=1 Tax=Pedobacter sp. MW01-1-1 TaxID=3383027 RepID=UPI003FF03471
MAFFKRRNHHPIDDFGFGSSPTSKNQRSLNHDGTVSLIRTGLPWFKFDDTYTRLVTTSWTQFFIIIFIYYIVVNCIFAFIYNLVGIEHLSGATGTSPRDHFFDAFFFSVQTISTVGYGHISPQGFITSCIAAFESMLGLLGFALATGLLYGRFSRPTSKVNFSKNMVIAPYGDGKGLMFRLINLRRNSLIDVKVSMTVAYNETVNGKTDRKFYTLALERSEIGLLSLNWTIVHPINEESPFFGKNKEELLLADVEIFVILKAFDDTFSQSIHTRRSYIAEEIEFGKKFMKMFHHNEEGKTVMDYSKLDTFEP